MKILFVGNTGHRSTSLFYFTNLVQLGHCVLPFNPDYFRTENTLQRGISRLLKKPSARRVGQVNHELIHLCEQNTFELIFVMGENFLDGKTIEAMRKKAKGSPPFIFHSHDNLFSNGVCTPVDFEDTLTSYNFVFTTKSHNVERYKDLGQDQAYYIPSAFEPTVHCPIHDNQSVYSERSFDVTFVGTYDHSRNLLVEAAGWQRLQVWGDFWVNYPKYGKYQQHIYPKAIYYFQYADVLSHSKCALGLLRAEAQDKHTQRTCEIPACGALQFCPRNDEVLSFF